MCGLRLPTGWDSSTPTTGTVREGGVTRNPPETTCFFFGQVESPTVRASSVTWATVETSLTLWPLPLRSQTAWPVTIAVGAPVRLYAVTVHCPGPVRLDCSTMMRKVARLARLVGPSPANPRDHVGARRAVEDHVLAGGRGEREGAVVRIAILPRCPSRSGRSCSALQRPQGSCRPPRRLSSPCRRRGV